MALERSCGCREHEAVHWYAVTSIMFKYSTRDQLHDSAIESFKIKSQLVVSALHSRIPYRKPIFVLHPFVRAGCFDLVCSDPKRIHARHQQGSESVH